MLRPVVLLLILLVPLAQAEEGRPRVISLDYCADQFVLGLADREQIEAVSPDAVRPFSFYRDQAARLPRVRAMAEDVIALRPDLVIRSWGGDTRALGFYERLGIKVHQIGYATDMAGIEREVRAAAAALYQVERGEELIATMPAAVEASGRVALYLTPGGMTTGEATLTGMILRRAGLTNGAGPGGWQALPLEALVRDPPDLAVLAFFGFGPDLTDMWSTGRHPVLHRLLRQAETLRVNESRITCPTWLVADEAAALSRALRGERE